MKKLKTDTQSIWKIKHMCWLSQEAVEAEQNNDLELFKMIKEQIETINNEVLHTKGKN